MKSLRGCGPSTNGVAEPLSVLQAVNGAMFAASLDSICPILGLGFILCYICAVLSIGLFWLYFFPLLTSSSLSFLSIFKDWGYMGNSQGVGGRGNGNGFGNGIGKAKRDMALDSAYFCLCVVFAWLWLIEGLLSLSLCPFLFSFCSMKNVTMFEFGLSL